MSTYTSRNHLNIRKLDFSHHIFSVYLLVEYNTYIYTYTMVYMLFCTKSWWKCVASMMVLFKYADQTLGIYSSNKRIQVECTIYRLFYVFYHTPHLYPYLELSGSLRADRNVIRIFLILFLSLSLSTFLVERIFVLENLIGSLVDFHCCCYGKNENLFLRLSPINFLSLLLPVLPFSMQALRLHVIYTQRMGR